MTWPISSIHGGNWVLRFDAGVLATSMESKVLVFAHSGSSLAF